MVDLVADGAAIHFEPPVSLTGSGYALAIDGRGVRLPEGVTSLAARSAGELWMAGQELWRGDGVGWRRIPMPDDADAEQVWLGGPGVV